MTKSLTIPILLALAAVGGCSSFSGQPKTAVQAQTQAAAGLVVVPSTATVPQTCNYDTPEGKLAVAIADSDKCPLKPPGAK